MATAKKDFIDGEKTIEVIKDPSAVQVEGKKLVEKPKDYFSCEHQEDRRGCQKVYCQ